MYIYEQVKPVLFTEEGQELFLEIRDRVDHLIKVAGAVRMQEVMRSVSGTAFEMNAAVDRLIELNEIKELTNANEVWGQERVFIRSHKERKYD